MKTNKTLSVKFQGNLVGTLASMEDGKIAFEYADRWYKNGFAISPFSLPLEKKCGITMMETKLFPSGKCKGYFGTVRFDRERNIDESGDVQVYRRHMLTAAALLELDFQQPCMDYHALMKLTKILTKDNKSEIENMYRRMCFNVFAHNRDDHAKNFTFLYDEANDLWRLSPAYDMTYSNTYYGEHTTSVDGNGTNPGKKELVAVGCAANMTRKKCEQIADEICDIVTADLN